MFYYACICKDNNDKYYPFVLKCSETENILGKINSAPYGYPHVVQPCKTKKRAEEYVRFWTSCHKANGTYMFSDTF